MKTIVKIIGCLCLFAVFSCDNNKEQIGENWTCTLPSPISGKWNLTYASYGRGGEINVEKGKYIWCFDWSEKRVKVENKTGEEGFMGINTGIYKIELKEGVITVFKAYETEEDYQGDCFLKKGKLWITNNPEVDGSAYMFERD